MALDFDLFFTIASEGGLAGNCVLSDSTALLCLSLLASEAPETLFVNADGQPLSQLQIEQATDIIEKAMNEISSAS